MVTRKTPADTPSTVGSGDSAANPPPAKKSRGLFAHYKSAAPSQHRTPAEVNPQQQLIDCLGKLTRCEFGEDVSMTGLCEQFPQLKPLFAYIFCVLASSAPVERVFSQSGLIMRPNRARMTVSQPTANITPLKQLFCTSTITSSVQWDHRKYHASAYSTSPLLSTLLTMTS